jgi:Zn-dependent alcohol dehydrogenase
VNFRCAIFYGLTSLLVSGCTVAPPPQRGYDAEVSVEEAGVRLLRNGMTVCLIRTEWPKIENWQLVNDNKDIVIKSRSDRGVAVIERFDTKTGIRKDRILAVDIKDGQPEWAQEL